MYVKIKQLIAKSAAPKREGYNSYFFPMYGASWMSRDYTKFAEEAYIKNVIAHRAISLIAHAAASIPLKLYKKQAGNKTPIHSHPILQLLMRPNPTQNGKEFLEMVYSYRQIAGNSFILGVGNEGKPPLELYCLRPDRVSVIAGESMLPKCYRYQVEKSVSEFQVDQVSGKSQILHIKNFHPLSDWYGLSSIEAAAYSIDQHNQAGQWNQALLQNGARPSGALVLKGEGDRPAHLNDTQFSRLKASIDELFTGARNAGKPLLLEGGLEWREMSMSPKDMDFIEAKHSSARDVALALGIPPQLLGIPGDNTYSNLQEARLAFWEQTVIPIAENVVDNLNQWFGNFFGHEHELVCDIDEVGALADKREKVWNRIAACPFMTINEKRQAVGLPSITGGDILNRV